MPDVIFTGPAGRLEGKVHVSKEPRAPVALVLHPHPQFGGTMNNQVTLALFQTFVSRGFTVMRFNFRGVGRSQGEFDAGIGELSDAAAALDWLQSQYSEAPACWIGGYSFGAWIAMQVLMRRPEIAGFMSVSPPANMYDFSFLAPCPSSGIILNGLADQVAPPADVQKLVDRLKTQKGILIEHQSVEGANHFYDKKVEKLMDVLSGYLDKRLAGRGVPGNE